MPLPPSAAIPDTDDVLVGPALDAVSTAAGLTLPSSPPLLHPTPPDHGFTSRSFDLRVGERPPSEAAALEAERAADAFARSQEAAKARAAAAAAVAAAAATATAAAAGAKPGGAAPASAPPGGRRGAAAARAAGSDDGGSGDGGAPGQRGRSTDDGGTGRDGSGGGLTTPRSGGGGGGGGGGSGGGSRSGKRKPRPPAPGPRVPAIPPHIHAQASFVAAGLEGMVAYIRSYGIVGAAADPVDAPGPGVRRCAKTAHARARACLRDGVLASHGLPPGPHPVVRKRDRSGEAAARAASRPPSGGGGGGGGGGDGGGTPATAPPAVNGGSRRSSRG